MKLAALLLSCLTLKEAYSFTSTFTPKSYGFGVPRSQSSLQMVDANVIQGAGIAVLGLGVGIGLVAFTEVQGERAIKRGGGVSDSMSTRLSGMFMEDVEVSSVDDVGSLANQLEAALKASGGTIDDLEMSEEDIKRKAEEADDGW